MIYKTLRKLLFLLPPERAHALSLAGLKGWSKIHCPSIDSGLAREVMGIHFPNPVGLAAGLDKNGDSIDALGCLGFGFVEVGTVTPRPQPGNPRPRLFRIPEAGAIINRMGFNNEGIDHLLARAARRRYRGVLGVNIGKNFDTPVERAVEDYRIGYRKAFPLADYVTVNISSPNTPGLRDLQQASLLEDLLGPLKDLQGELEARHEKRTPLVVKVAPDLDEEAVALIAGVVNRLGIEGVIATNTTLSRHGVEGLPHGDEAGGLSGRPLRTMSTETLQQFRRHLDASVALIAAGGIFSEADLAEKLSAGADLAQIYSGLIYEGPGLVKRLIQSLH